MEAAKTSIKDDVETVKNKQIVLPTREFPQIKRRQLLRFDFLRSTYSRLTNNNFCFNTINKRYKQAAKYIPTPSLNKVSERVVQDLSANGIAFANFNEFFDSEFFAQLKQCFNDYLENFNKTIGNSKLNKGKGAYLDTIHKSHTFTLNDLVSNYLSTPLFATIALHYMQMVPRFIGSSFWHTREAATEAERIYSQQWHRDYNDRTLVKVFLYITDVGPQEGYFEYLTNSHGRGKLGKFFDHIGKDGYRKYPDANKIAQFLENIPHVQLHTIEKDKLYGKQAFWSEQPTIIQCTAPKGTLIFADTFGLHRGGYVQKGHRDMIMTTYSTNFNIHKPHFAITKDFANSLDKFMQMSFGIL